MESSSKINHDRRPLRSEKEVLSKKPPGLGLHQHLKSKRTAAACALMAISILASWLLPKPALILLLLLLSAALVPLATVLAASPATPQIYMVDFWCYAPPSFCRVPRATFMEHIQTMGLFDAEGVGLMERVLASSGQGERTCLPPSLFFLPPRPYQKESLEEARMALFHAMDALLRKADMGPRDVDILVVNCSGFCPSPSLCSLVVNRFRLREDVKTFSLSGMGCSASMAALHMAANLLKVHRNSNAVILSTEILTTGWYPGKDHSKLALNCLFRMGSAAILLTNIKHRKTTSKYKLIRSQRTQLSSDDRAYHSAFREEDQQGVTGVTLSRDILQVAGETLKKSIVDLAPSILPMSEKLKYVASLIKTSLFKGAGNEGVYVPNFKTTIAHFCVPTSGRRVIREIAKGLRLDEEDTEAAVATLHRFGNQSSSALWYELAYLEAKGRVKKGDKVWQLGMGSGPKSTSVVWECIGPVSEEPEMSPWADCIDQYPSLAFDFD